ncbi:adenine phosphoribosyltransferase [Mycoplasmopsis columbinasalis]|uniref:Adenine phosphoribosyltransferase n=1 Tax=Mycoplasmopsis columbinasalis TaxID=114880 RepID=A0A449BAW0_9BACT|nr:adenine phosphoribosyltransferase [Mycoplasmopsis columbinasalis]VEU78327.1 adenine phosphoribosyltransferase [Mycoplasmopsis columbinasalis]
MNYEKYIRTVYDFPTPGVEFKDISPLLFDADAFHQAIEEMAAACKDCDVIIGADARGFVFGAAIALRLKKPFLMARKKHKLPGDVVTIEYGLEYGKNTLELQTGFLQPGQKVAVCDDVLATGGTNEAVVRLAEQNGAKVEKVVVLVELAYLDGRKRLEDQGYQVHSLVQYHQ